MIKQRIARSGQGKSGGYRSIILFRKGEVAFFIYGFAKNDRENIEPDDLAIYKKAAKVFLALSDKQLQALLQNEEFKEIL